MPVSSLRIAIALSLAAALLQPSLTLAAVPLPACRYDDLPTRYTAYSAWRKTLLDTIYMVPPTYVPPSSSPPRTPA